MGKGICNFSIDFFFSEGGEGEGRGDFLVQLPSFVFAYPRLRIETMPGS